MPALDGPVSPNPLHVEVYIGVDVEMDLHTKRTLQLLSCGKDDDSIGELVRKLVANVLGKLPSSRLTITGSRAEEEVR